MTTRSTASEKAAEAREARAEARRDSDTDVEETPTSIAEPESPALPYTVEDKVHGVDRIVLPAGTKWEPAPVDPDPDEVERMKQLEKRQEERRNVGLTPFQDRTTDDEGRTRAKTDAEKKAEAKDEDKDKS